jgi:hypothetical protein
MLRHHRPESRQYRVIGTLKSVKKLKRLNRPKVHKKPKDLELCLIKCVITKPHQEVETEFIEASSFFPFEVYEIFDVGFYSAMSIN